MKKLFVGNLSWKVTEDSLKEFFEKVGQVQSVKIVTDQYTGKSRGFGFVEMDSSEDAQNAIKELHDKPLLDRNLRVSLAQERSERRDYRGSGNQYSGSTGSGGGGQRPYRQRQERNY